MKVPTPPTQQLTPPPQQPNEEESWINYVERLEAFFEANDVTSDSKKKSILISVLNPETYARLRSLLAPSKPKDETYDTIIRVLTQHLSPEPSEIYETFRFQTRVQNSGESVADYLAELRKIADHYALDTTLAAELAISNASRLPGSSDTPAATAATGVNALEQKKRHGNQKASRPPGKKPSCIRCGEKSHSPPECPHKNTTCFKCNKRGHLASQCFGNKTPGHQGKFQSNMMLEEEPESFYLSTVQSQKDVRSTAYTTTLNWGGVELQMQVDTGSPVCVIAEETYRRRAHFWPKLEPTDKTLYCYTGKLPLLGVLKLVVNNPTGETEGELYVTKCSSPSLCSRDIIQKLNILGPNSVTFVQVDGSVQETVTKLKREFSDLFQPGTGLMKGPPAHINLKKEVNPKFFKARSLPYAIRDKVARELDRLCEEACEVDQYPLPKVEDMFANLKDGYWFTKLDLREAYCHVPLDESKKAAVLNTHKGLFSYNRLPYGIASAPAIFQRKMEAVLKDIPGTQVFLDDILVAERQHEFGTTLRKVLSALRDNGIKLREEKCIFGEEGVNYLGHRIDREVTKFRDYLLGRSFVLKTDHEPLVGLFKETKAVPAVAAARIQRWGLILGAHQYTIKYKPGQQNGNADALSRLPAEEAEDTNSQSEQVLSTSLLDSSPLSRQQLEELTQKDPVLMEVRHQFNKDGQGRLKIASCNLSGGYDMNSQWTMD
ncbi:uncharacterized protein K02A2.6-like [Rhipicephalus sanguineus]|uniref:uncharacterized protein K02A2.6-like n=1 Tax=Rhipicephalus sanguineus TaxID=34632 RepID=UPI001894389F|nr:uncharacterized protein K02A2.6-like [Rhipicephalus sanguineus]